jgi:hypothetical protein
MERVVCEWLSCQGSVGRDVQEVYLAPLFENVDRRRLGATKTSARSKLLTSTEVLSTSVTNVENNFQDLHLDMPHKFTSLHQDRRCTRSCRQ